MMNDRFAARFRILERLAADRTLRLRDLSLEELDALWEEAKSDYSAESGFGYTLSGETEVR